MRKLNTFDELFNQIDMKNIFIALALLVSTTSIAQTEKALEIETKTAWVTFDFIAKNTQGMISNIEAEVLIDPINLANSKIVGTADVSSIDTGNEQRDHHLKADDLFDAAQFPTMRFESSDLRLEGENYIASGNLTIRDVTKEVEFLVKFEGMKLIFATTINAFDYGVSVKDKREGNVVDVQVHIPLK